MKYLSLIAFLVIYIPAHAGFWSNFCEKHLIADDPYQFEQTPMDWLLRERAKLAVKAAWQKAGKRELNMLEIIDREIARREIE